MIVYRIPDTTPALACANRRRAVRLANAARSGVLAGAALAAVLMFLSVTVYDESIWRLPRMIAATVLGPGVLQPEDAFDGRVVLTMLALQLDLGIACALALTRVAGRLQGLGLAALGLGFGVALYGLDLYALPLAFPWLAELRSVDTFMAHLLFGLLATAPAKVD
ncbi:MAG TPA: hypothetical protein VM122_14300 [Usitatibacter sp.]|nr:hypothetical protein [Usitatibacter sp.]